MKDVLIADTNEEVLDTLMEFYGIDADASRPRKVARPASLYLEPPVVS